MAIIVKSKRGNERLRKRNGAAPSPKEIPTVI
jgi:hypothetical protein